MNKKTVLLFLLSAFFATSSPQDAKALDFWQYPEMAESHSLFFSFFAVNLTFTDYFKLNYPEMTLDYLLPFGFPLSLGASFHFLESSLNSAGARLAYHVNFDNENLDLYFLYYCKFIFPSEELWLEYGGRIGFRYRFGTLFCFTVETGFKMQDILIGIAIKCN